jgi:hypothetical protein
MTHLAYGNMRIGTVAPKPGQVAADRIAGRVFDRIEHDRTLIKQNVAEEIRQGLLLRDAERADSGEATEQLMALIAASEVAIKAIEHGILQHFKPSMDTLVPLGELHRLTYRLKHARRDV